MPPRPWSTGSALSRERSRSDPPDLWCSGYACGVGIAVIVLFLGAIGGLVFVLGARQRRKRDDALDGIAAAVSGMRCDSGRGAGIQCQLHGAAAELWFVTRGSGSSAQSWTEIDVVLPQLYPLSINVRRHGWLDAGKIERGTMIDVDLGDPEFDAAFLVEVAPADVARVLLDAGIRSMLAVHRTLELTTTLDGDRRILRLAILGWLEHRELALPALDGVARIAGRVREAYAIVEAAATARDTGSPYRPLADDRAARAAADARAAEVQTIEALRAERAAHTKLVTTIAIAIIAALIGLAWLAML
jgi:hypothetical protein